MKPNVLIVKICRYEIGLLVILIQFSICEH